jgi:hypothetical protein
MSKSYKELKEYLQYNSETGIIYWIKSPRIGIKKGWIAGGKDKDGYVLMFVGLSLQHTYTLKKMVYYND